MDLDRNPMVSVSKGDPEETRPPHPPLSETKKHWRATPNNELTLITKADINEKPKWRTLDLYKPITFGGLTRVEMVPQSGPTNTYNGTVNNKGLLGSFTYLVMFIDTKTLVPTSLFFLRKLVPLLMKEDWSLPFQCYPDSDPKGQIRT